MNRRQFLESAALAAAAAGLPPQPPPAAQTTHGPVTGYYSGTILAFKGIPYGADTRTSRFQQPLAPAPWTTPRECTAWPTRAPQQQPERAHPAHPAAAGMRALEADDAIHYHLPADQGIQSEDCLYLNLWTPALDRRKRPVLVYLHGGAYNNGTVNAALYDGTRLAQKDAVVVTINHRLNAFGYLYLAELGPDYASSGNAGMLDLILALHWVRNNIARFGGDPANVTIFGQSGGGAKCATLMAMPAARGLFHKVWTMSGQQVWAAPAALASSRASTALAAMGLPAKPTLAQLGALTTAQIQAGARTTNDWMPVLDQSVLLRDPFSPDAPPQSANIPMILGNTRDEVAGATFWQRTGVTWEQLPGLLAPALAPFRGSFTAEQIILAYRGWYPSYTPNDVYTAAVAAFRSWPGQVLEAERRAAEPASATHTWVYQIDFPSPTANGRAPHTLDLAFVFDNLRLSPGMIGSSEAEVAAAQPLATQMSGALLAFARTGNPNHAGLPRWPVYQLSSRATMLFDRPSRVADDPRGREREMMAKAHYRQPGTA